MLLIRFSFLDEAQNFEAHVIAEWFESLEIFIENLVFSFGDQFNEITNISSDDSGFTHPEWFNTPNFWKV